MAFYAFVFVGMAPLGAFQAGLIAEHTGAPIAIALGGAGCLIAVGLAAWQVPALRRTPLRRVPYSSRVSLSATRILSASRRSTSRCTAPARRTAFPASPRVA